jgi:hypothetical protein
MTVKCGVRHMMYSFATDCASESCSLLGHKGFKSTLLIFVNRDCFY